MKRCITIFLIFMLVTVLFAEKVNDQFEKRNHNWESGSTEFVSNNNRDSRSVPNLIDYQGRITDSDDIPISSSVSITFAIYSASSGGGSLWSETHSGVTAADGLVHVLLGSVDAFGASLFDGSDLWLGINVNSDGEMTPRLRIVSVPYAIYAQTAETDNDWTISGDDLYTDNSGSVGIGTTSPDADTKLHVNNGTILFDGTTGSTPVSGAGTRFIWIPSKSALRAGQVNGTQWDDANMGSYSVAFGYNNTALGGYSLAQGLNNNITTFGNYATALGADNTINRPYSLAAGSHTTIDGSYAMALGRYLTAQANNSFVIGRYNVISGTWNLWEDDEPLFVIGNGADDSNRSNAITVFKDGRTTIGSDTRGEMLTVEGTIESTSGGVKFPDGTTQTTAAGGGATEIDDLSDAKTGGHSVFLGLNSGINDDGLVNYNTGIGEDALTAINTGSYNSSLGYQSLYSNQTSVSNCAFGYKSLYSTTNGGNNAFGAKALEKNTTGTNNQSFGFAALWSNTSGEDNIGIGYYANYYNQTGSQNTIVGNLAGQGNGNHNKSGNVFIGYMAGYWETGDNKLYIENSNSSAPLIYGEFDNDIVKINGDFQVTGENRDSSGDAGTSGQVLSSTAVGTDWIDNPGATEIDELSDAKTDTTSVFLGSDAGSNDDGSDNRNVALGIGALKANTTGFSNTAVGYQSLYNNSTGSQNTAYGFGALYKNTGSFNTASGHYSLFNNIGNSNTAYGIHSLGSNTSGSYNVGVGTSANRSNKEGSENTIIGCQAGDGAFSVHNKSGNVFLGFKAGYSEYGDNKLYIENSDSSTPLIGGDFSTDKVTINDVLILTPSSVPSDPTEGEIYVSSYNHHIWCYLNGSWKQLDN